MQAVFHGYIIHYTLIHASYQTEHLCELVSLFWSRNILSALLSLKHNWDRHKAHSPLPGPPQSVPTKKADLMAQSSALNPLLHPSALSSFSSTHLQQKLWKLQVLQIVQTP